MNNTHADDDEPARLISGFGPLSNCPHKIAVQPVAIPPGISASPVTVGVKPKIFCANKGKINVPPYKPKPSAKNIIERRR